MQNLPDAYPHNMVGILWNGGYSYGTFFSANPLHIHGIQYLPVCPGFKYLAKNPTWAAREYSDLMSESAASEGYTSELGFGDDWAHVALGFRMLYDPQYVTNFFDTNLALGKLSSDYIMDYEVAGMSYYYAHSIQNLGQFSFKYYTNFPSSSVFEKNGVFSHAVVYNATNSDKTCNIYDQNGAVVTSFSVAANSLITYPELPNIGKEPANCYALATTASASSNNTNAGLAVDASMGTRWSATSTGVESLNLDLGTLCTLNEISISWEVACAKRYTVEASANGTNWSEVGSFSNLPQGDRTDVLTQFSNNYRYLRINMLEAASPWNYSIYEVSICGKIVDNGAPTTIKPSEKVLSDGFSLFPNPANDEINISLSSSSNYIIEVYNISGIMIYSRKVYEEATPLKINLLGWPSGIYTVKVINSNNEIEAKRFIVK